MLRYIVITTVVLLFILSCKDSSVDPVDSISSDNAYAYYPGEKGTLLKYRIDTLNSATSQFDSVSSEISVFAGEENVGGTNYSIQINDQTGETELLFRRTEAALYFYADTTGLDSLTLALPPQLTEIISFEADREAIVLSTPFQDNKSWTTYKLNMVIEQDSIRYSYSIIDIKAFYEGSEVFNDMLSEKIKYQFTLRIPAVDNLFDPPASVYEGEAWFTESAGLTGIKGNGAIVGFLGGGDINISDTLTKVQRILTEYQIK